MKKHLLMAVSALAIVASAPAMADTQKSRTTNQKGMAEYSKEEVKQGWEDTKDAVSETAKDISEAAEGVVKDTTEAVKDLGNAGNVSARTQFTASADQLIGMPVYNPRGERVATLKDIIIDQDGEAKMAVLADGEWIGLGKTVAFDYNVLLRKNKDGEVVASVTEDMIEGVVPFTYDRDTEETNVTVIPGNAYSTTNLLGAEIYNADGKDVAEIEDITFANGHAQKIVLSYDEFLGMGGKEATMRFEDANIVRQDDDLSIKLSAAGSAAFKDFKERPGN